MSENNNITVVNFVKPFSDPTMITKDQFYMLVGGKVYDKSLPKGYKGYYGLLNQMVEKNILDRTAHVGSDNTPTWGTVFDFTAAVNDNGVPFRKWTNLFSYDKNQARFIIKQALALIKAAEVADPEMVPTVVVPTTVAPATDHQMVGVIKKSPEKDGLPDGVYHLEGSGGFYTKVSTGKDGKKRTFLVY
jgi:hypothetical protein